MDIKKLLEVRKSTKGKKPKFVRQDFHKKAGLKKKWRRPKGLQSKLRLGFRGKGRSVTCGYRSPRKVRGLHKTGLEEKRIRSIKELGGLDPKKCTLIISSSVGIKKKIEILKKAEELNFNVSNINANEFIKRIEAEMTKKKEVKEKEKKTSKGKIEKKGKKLAEKVSSEDEKEVEKKKKDEILTKRER